MYISDKKSLSLEYFIHAHARKEKIQSDRKHNEDRTRVHHEHDMLMEDRKIASKEHEAVKKQNEIAMDKEVDQKMAFIKKSLGLNII